MTHGPETNIDEAKADEAKSRRGPIVGMLLLVVGFGVVGAAFLMRSEPPDAETKDFEASEVEPLPEGEALATKPLPESQGELVDIGGKKVKVVGADIAPTPAPEHLMEDARENSYLRYFEGQGWARIDPSPENVPPPPLDEMPENPNPKPTNEGEPEQKPITPDYRLEKTNHIFDRMTGRLDRLEAQIAEARAAGDAVEAKRKKLIMDRTMDRLEELEMEMEALREEVAKQQAAADAEAAAAGTTAETETDEQPAMTTEQGGPSEEPPSSEDGHDDRGGGGEGPAGDAQAAPGEEGG